MVMVVKILLNLGNDGHVQKQHYTVTGTKWRHGKATRKKKLAAEWLNFRRNPRVKVRKYSEYATR